MSSEKATAIVLRVVDFSETSSVVTLFTREFGKVRGLAKGARRPKGPFDAALDLVCLCRIVFLRKSSEALDLLTEAKLERRFRGRGRDLSCLYAAYYVAELLSELTDDYDPHPELFDAANQTLIDLGAVGPVPELVLRFELTALRLLGHLPSLDQCVECGRPIASTGRVSFSQSAGGVLCAACRPGKPHVVSVSPAALGALRQLSRAGDSAFAVETAPWGELRGLMNHYLSHLLGKTLRMPRYLAVGRGSPGQPSSA